MTDESVEELLPEWTSFWDAVQQRGFTEGTARVAWTVRELVAHQAGNAAELATVLAAFVEDRPVPATRSFEEREPLVGDDETSREQLAQPWLTSHSVLSVGLPLLQKGAARLDPNEPFLARLRVNGHDDVVISGPAFPHIELRSIEGQATLETDLATPVRCARWFVRQAMHEGRHHLDDIRSTAAAVATGPDPSGG